MFAYFGEFFMPMHIYIGDIVFHLILLVLSYHFTISTWRLYQTLTLEWRRCVIWCAVSFVKSFIKAWCHSIVN